RHRRQRAAQRQVRAAHLVLALGVGWQGLGLGGGHVGTGYGKRRHSSPEGAHTVRAPERRPPSGGGPGGGRASAGGGRLVGGHHRLGGDADVHLVAHVRRERTHAEVAAADGGGG